MSLASEVGRGPVLRRAVTGVLWRPTKAMGRRQEQTSGGRGKGAPLSAPYTVLFIAAGH
jgi:hypothetical protein